MRRALCLSALLALVLPVVATAGANAPGDGSLSVRDLDGTEGVLYVRARGTIVGRCDSCRFLLEDLADDAVPPVVAGAERAQDLDKDGLKEWWSGTDIRWKLVGSNFRLRINRGRDVDLSVVGKGWGRVKGQFGLFSVNGAPFDLVFPEWTPFTLAEPAPATTPSG